MRPGCFDIHERVRDMNVNGVLASMNFPSYPQFCGQYFARASDKDLALAVLRAYNDWHVDECGPSPGRMIPLALPANWDVERWRPRCEGCPAKGCHAVTFSEIPKNLAIHQFTMTLGSIWRACSDGNVVRCLHIGSSL